MTGTMPRTIFRKSAPTAAFKMPDVKVACVYMGPTMDMQILRELFGNCIKAAKMQSLVS